VVVEEEMEREMEMEKIQQKVIILLKFSKFINFYRGEKILFINNI